jgi:TPR repeat protein
MSTVHLVVAALLGLAMQAAYADELDRAQLAYGNGHYAIAHDELLSASRKGDAQAQELLGIMYLVGPPVFPGVPQDLTQAAVLLDRAARNGRPTAKVMHCALARRGTLRPPHKAPCFHDPSMASVAGPR